MLLRERGNRSGLIDELRGSVDSGRGKIHDAGGSVSQHFHQSVRAFRWNRMQDQSARREAEPFRVAMGRGDGGAASQEAPGHSFASVAAAQNQNVQSFTT
jgi:hypothetical protein